MQLAILRSLTPRFLFRSGAIELLIQYTRVFIQFLALTLLSRIRTVSRDHTSLKHKTSREIIETMETVAQIACQSRATRMITEAGPVERTIMDAFGIMRT